jgi:hypothetical protein
MLQSLVFLVVQHDCYDNYANVSFNSKYYVFRKNAFLRRISLSFKIRNLKILH